MISAKTVADSICNGHRITSMLATMPRFILAEFNTHRMLSRSSASSRAIPLKKMVETIKNNPFIPIAWQKDHKGMQGIEYLDERSSMIASELWKLAAATATETAERFNNPLYGLKVTKQLCNRLLEPFMYHTVLCTATEWENFFYLRCPQYALPKIPHKVFRSRKNIKEAFKDFNGFYGDSGEGYTELEWLSINKGQAEIHMMALAEAMWDARNESEPKELKPGEWHIPFGDNIRGLEFADFLGELFPGAAAIDFNVLDDITMKIATARCARTSYTVFGDEGKVANYQKDIELHDRLLASGHMSPFEHCAQAMTKQEQENFVRTVSYEKSEHIGYDFNSHTVQFGWCHNFCGWKSYRSMIPNENRR